jgi:hypothetical protein
MAVKLGDVFNYPGTESEDSYGNKGGFHIHIVVRIDETGGDAYLVPLSKRSLSGPDLAFCAGERPCAQARRVRIARPRPARPTASSAIDVGSGTGKGAATSGLNVDDEIPLSSAPEGLRRCLKLDPVVGLAALPVPSPRRARVLRKYRSMPRWTAWLPPQLIPNTLAISGASTSTCGATAW